ncbi:MAG: hypothetical protein HKN25_06140 [Pyrinomonadaceae bacterium]|nr:hypothetical protein [Pyrinomonadaceae bacterium]
MVISLSIIFSYGCRFWSGTGTKPGSDLPVAEVQTNVPFETKVPETFQAEIVVSTYAGGKKMKRTYFIAKKGVKSIVVFDHGTENEKADLQTDLSTSYLIDRKRKVWKKRTRSGKKADDDELRKFLTTKWLNEKIGAEFENLGATDNLAKYRVRLAESEKTEVIIFIDENLNIPVKQEFYSIVDDQRVLSYSVKVENIKTDADDKLFTLPEEYTEELKPS